MLEEIIAHIKTRPGALIAPAGEICRKARAGLLGERGGAAVGPGAER